DNGAPGATPTISISRVSSGNFLVGGGQGAQSPRTGTATCPVGSSVVGGGYAGPDDVNNYIVTASQPNSGATNWSVTVRRTGGQGSENFVAYALCMTVSTN